MSGFTKTQDPILVRQPIEDTNSIINPTAQGAGLLPALIECLAAPEAGSPEESLATIEDVAARYGLDPDELLNALEQPDWMRHARAHSQLLRQRGDLMRMQLLPAIEKLIANARRMADADAISPAVLPRLLDTLFRLSGIGEERAANLRASANHPAAPVLTLAVLDGDMPMPQRVEGGLSLTIIAPTWRGGQERVVAEQDGGDQ